MNSLFLGLAALIMVVSAKPAHAVPVQSFGAGTAVASAELIATFDGIVQGTNLDLYQEGGLTFMLSGTQTGALCQSASPCPDHTPFDALTFGFIYGGSPVGFPLIITTDDGSEMTGIEFNLASGWNASNPDNINGGYWEAYRDGTLTGSDTFVVPGFPIIFGLVDASGFDEFRIAMFEPLNAPTPGFAGKANAIAIDNVVAGPVPEPSSLFLLASGLLGLAAWRYRKRVG